MSDLWGTLSTPQKDAWNTLALATPFLNTCGETYFLSAYRIYTKVNGVLLNFGSENMLLTAPTSYGPPASTAAYSLSLVTQNYYTDPVRMLNFTAPADCAVIVISQPNQNTGLKGYRFISNILYARLTDEDNL